FDPYHTWLGIAPSEQPPNHYRLLGIALFEESRDVISNSADRQMAHIRTFQNGKHAAESQKLLNELSAARVTLLDPKKRADYDAKLRATMYPPAPVAPPPYQMRMGQQMPPQQMGMGGVPVPPPAPPARPMPPAPPAPPAPPILGAAPSKHSGKKHSHSNDDSIKLYIVIGVIAVAIIALVIMISKGSKKEPEIAQTQETTKENDFNAFNSEDVGLGIYDFPEEQREVQEHILDNPEPTPKKKTEPETTPAKKTVDEEKTAPATPAAKAESVDEVKSDPDAETEKPTAADPEDDAASEASQDEEKPEKTKETPEEETGSKSKKNSTKPKDTEKTDPGIPDEEIKKLGTGITLWMEPKREKMLKFYGASNQVQPEIDLAVEWLNDKMIRNSKLGVNFWSFDHSQAKKGAGYKKVQNTGLAKQNYISATSLSLMAIFGSGQIDQKEKQNYAKAINFLMYNAKPASDEQVLPANYEHAKKLEASLIIEENENAAFHPHAWGTTAVCNYIALSREMNDRKEKNLELYEVFAKALVRHITRQQNPDGGFPAVERGLNVDYMLKTRRTADHSSSVISTVWNLIALQAAETAEIPVSKEVIEKANTYLTRTIKTIKASHKNFVDLTKSEIREIRTALFGIQIFGEDFPTYAESVHLLEQILAKYDESQLQENFICTMYARDLRGDSWKNWREKVVMPYLKAQYTDKLEKGSWYFAGEVINDEGGRLYCTAMTALILESFYRNAPTRPLDEWSTEAVPEVEVPTPTPAASSAAPAAATTPAASATAPAAATPATAAKEEEPQESFLGEGQKLELTAGDDDDDDDDDEE
ncbi:MAG: hypothetical protein K6C40_12055, partial [Thermoguttaceae bacterium]|nr:hypothetical protein [Thermoguttaceae bacterium]